MFSKVLKDISRIYLPMPPERQPGIYIPSDYTIYPTRPEIIAQVVS